MAPRSNVITMLPAHVRNEVEKRLFENGFRDYEGLAQWVRGQGYDISEDSLWRYGRRLQQQLVASRLTVHQAAAFAEISAGHEDAMAQTLMTIAQQKALESLLEMEQVRPADLNAIANLIRAGIARQRRASDARALREHPESQAAGGRTALTVSPVDQNPALPQSARAGSLASAAALHEQANPHDAHQSAAKRVAACASRVPVMSVVKDAADAEADPPSSSDHRSVARGRECSPALDGSLSTASRSASAAPDQPALHRASPRIAADKRAPGCDNQASSLLYASSSIFAAAASKPDSGRECSIRPNGSLPTALRSASAASEHAAPHRASPQIAADPRASDLGIQRCSSSLFYARMRQLKQLLHSVIPRVAGASLRSTDSLNSPVSVSFA